MKIFFAKDVQFGIRNHISIENFCKKYECTDEEFNRRLRHLYGHNTDAIIKELNASAEKASKKSKKSKKAAVSAENITPAESLEILPVSSKTDEETTEKPVEDTEKEYLSELKSSESKLREEINQIEIAHKEHKNKRAELLKAIKGKKSEIDKLITNLSLVNKEVETLKNQANLEAAAMNELSEKRCEKKDSLESISLEIENLERIKLFIETDGTVHSVDGKTFTISDEESAKLAQTFFADERFENYRVSAIKNAARVICIINTFDVKVDVDFADDEVGIVYLEYLEHQKIA